MNESLKKIFHNSKKLFLKDWERSDELWRQIEVKANKSSKRTLFSKHTAAAVSLTLTVLFIIFFSVDTKLFNSIKQKQILANENSFFISDYYFDDDEYDEEVIADNGTEDYLDEIDGYFDSYENIF